jgi:FtsP/CotA-like multicopper oxidase with cupredoxin domain
VQANHGRNSNYQQEDEEMKTKKAMVMIGIILLTASLAGAQVEQTELEGEMISQFLDPLPLLDLTASGTNGIDTLIATSAEIELHMREFKANVMPTGFKPANGLPYAGTTVFGYINGTTTPTSVRATYTGPVIVATRNVPTQIRFVNDLGVADPTYTNPNASKMFAFVNSTDQTLHWADPLNDESNMCNHMIQPMTPPMPPCDEHYAGPIPAVPHLHGGYVPPTLDGGPDGWFTSDGAYHGHTYYTHPGVPAAANEQVLRYPNGQEAAMIWFHDHLLGGTRINVYCGIAGAYPIIDPALTLPVGLHPVGLQQGAGGAVDLLIPLVIQDRSFDVNGELYFPNEGINPEHPYWVPEFLGDTILVNGKVWPFLNVQARRSRFLIINGSNSRPYEMFLVNPVTKVMGPTIWQIGTDGGYLDAPVKIDPNAPKPEQAKLVVLPGERAEIIVDFSGLQGQTLLLRNIAKAPYPAGEPPDATTTGRIMLFRVSAPSAGFVDQSYDPATGTPIRTGTNQIVRLVDPATGTLAPGVTVTHNRQLTLNEVIGEPEPPEAGGPLEILVNNTTWSGEQPGGGIRPDFTGITVNGKTLYQSELPQEGTTEVWEIINLTADTHPMHTHLIQCQILNRQAFDVKKYTAAYNSAFPSGDYEPGYGPPLDYTTGNPLALGGNPDITPFLKKPIDPPLPNEAGWKDTMECPPGTVTRFVARFAPQSTPVVPAQPADLFFPFDPFALDYNYVWHCHIVDHEDNEMMRPYSVMPATNAVRTYIQGVDY